MPLQSMRAASPASRRCKIGAVTPRDRSRLCWLGAALVCVVVGCEPTPATQVLIRFEAEPLSRARADGMRIRVFDTDGFTKLDQTLALGTGDTQVVLPVRLPLIPRAEDARRTFAVVASLLEEGEAFNTQRILGGYAEGRLVEIEVLFEDACADVTPCPGRETCSEGVCTDACLSPSPSECPRDASPCGECTTRTDAGCVPAAEGEECSGGTCRVGACCTGCWDGATCQPGTEPSACGIAGSGCFSCACPTHGCAAGTCAVPRTAARLAAGGHHSCAVGPEDELFCWGENATGIYLTGDATMHSDPVEVPTVQVEQIALGVGHVCTLDASGGLRCWGDNDNGEVGIGAASVDPVAEPTRVGDAVWKAVALGNDHTCAIRDDGALFCWGLGASGRLGLGDIMDRAEPAQVGTGTDWVAVSAGAAFTCGLRDDGSIWCWGGNYWGQLGQGNTTSSRVPLAVIGTHSYQDLAAGALHVCAVATGGGMWCWGRSSSGQSGSDTAERVSTPARVGADADFASVIAGELHTCALRADRSLWCWGENGNGQLGQGNTTDLAAPARVGDETDWVDLAAGLRHTCALRSDGTSWCFGRNDLGQLGSRNTSTYRRPRATCLPLP